MRNGLFKLENNLLNYIFVGDVNYIGSVKSVTFVPFVAH